MHLSNKRIAAVLVSSFVLALVFLAPPVTQGDEWNLATRFKVNHPTEVPGLTLEANTPYVIRLHDSPAVRNVVQIFNDDESQMLTMFMGIRSERMEPADDTTFTFIEMQPGHPLPIREWFYPGRLSGLEFIYPKDQAMKIAGHAREPILATDDDVNLHDLASIEVEAIGPLSTDLPTTATATAEATPAPALEEEAFVEEEAVVTEESEDVAVTEPEPIIEEEAETEIAQADVPDSEVESEDILREKPSEEAVSEPVEETPSELPATAGELPLIGLLGILCLGAGLGLRVLSAKN